jgi:hypothetical protein
VGSGTFLLEGARQLEQQGLVRFWERLHGFDIAPQVIGVAQVNLYLTVLGLLNRKQAEQVGILKLYPTDALDPRNGAKLRSVLPLLTDDSTRRFLERRIGMSEEIKRSSHFTLVIGNPPYKNNSTRTLAQVASVFPRLLKSSRENARAKDRNIRDDYAWFFAAADHYTTDKGLIAFVVSDSFCYARSYRYFREDLLRQYRILKLIHLGRFVFRDVGPRTSFIIIILERRTSNLADAAQTEPIEYIDLRPLALEYRGPPGALRDPRLLALEHGRFPASTMQIPNRGRDFALFPAADVVGKVLHHPIVLHGTTPRRVFVKKWPGIITAFDKLFKAADAESLAARIGRFFEISHMTGTNRNTQLEAFGREIRLDQEEQARLAELAKQAVEKDIEYNRDRVKRTITGSAPNGDAWYPSQQMTAYLYYEPGLLAPRNINPGRKVGWGSMSQWREPESHTILPKLVFTTSTNPQAGLKAFVLRDEWLVKLAAGTRQQLNYTGVRNPLIAENLSGPNNLGSEALELYAALEARGLGDEDFLLYIAGIYNSELSHDYLSGGGGNMLHIPVNPQRLDLKLVTDVIAISRMIRNLRQLQHEIFRTVLIAEPVATLLAPQEQLESFGFVAEAAVGGRFRQERMWRSSGNSAELIEAQIDALKETLDQDVEAVFGVS